MSEMVDLEGYYTASQAAEVLSRNSGKDIAASYVRNLARYGKLEPKQVVGTRLNLYPKAQVDAYVVEDRGVKVNRVKKERAREQAAYK